MAAGKQQQQQQGQGVVATASAEPGAARRLWRVVRAVLYMLRRGLPSGRKLAMDLHLLLHRGKIAGRALGELFLAFHHGSHGHGRHAAAAFSYEPSGGAGAGAFSCRALDPSLAVHEPAPRRARREVEFSCSNTPSSATGGGLAALGLLGGKRRRRQHHHRDDAGGYLQYYTYPDAAEVARMFELLNDDDDADGGEHRRVFSNDDDDSSSASASASAATSAAPSPAARMLHWAAASRGGSPAVSSRTPRGAVAAESPAQVDRRADEFIRRFYEQLRAQRSAASTPDCYGYNANAAAATSRSPRPVLTAGGIA